MTEPFQNVIAGLAYESEESEAVRRRALTDLASAFESSAATFQIPAHVAELGAVAAQVADLGAVAAGAMAAGAVSHADIVASFQGLKSAEAAAEIAWSATAEFFADENAAARARLTEQIERIARSPAFRQIEQAAKDEKLFKRMDAAGWLPGRFAPLQVVEDCQSASDDELSEALAHHFNVEWPQIAKEFRDRLARYEVDDEAKATFREALQAHRRAFYRTVPRTLFPEIERVVRVEFHGGGLTSITSQRGIRDGMDDLTLWDLEPRGLAGFAVALRFMNHMYQRVDQGNLAAIVSDPVPNRHASIHGYTTYRTVQSSLNALILTEFAFRLVTVLKEKARKL